MHFPAPVQHADSIGEISWEGPGMNPDEVLALAHDVLLCFLKARTAAAVVELIADNFCKFVVKLL